MSRERGYSGTATFWASPFLGPLLFQNESSDARDHCANERSGLSPSSPSPLNSLSHVLEESRDISAETS